MCLIQLGAILNKLIVPVVGLILSTVIVAPSVQAEPSSCSSAGTNCRAQVKLKASSSQLALGMSMCATAVQECKERCNGKTSVYVSKFDGSQHPTGSCK